MARHARSDRHGSRLPGACGAAPFERVAIATEGVMRTAARVVGVLVVLSGAARVARAQCPQRRDGFWIGFGLGYGSATVSCDNCGPGSRTDGITGFLQVGGSPSHALRVGGAIN